MAGPKSFMWEALEARLVAELKNVVWEWKSTVCEEVFLRWTQALSFSEYEPAALIQRSGGPCAIIAPVQAYILKSILFGSANNEDGCGEDATEEIDLRSFQAPHNRAVLCKSLSEILSLACHGDKCKLVAYSSQPLESTSSADFEDGESTTKKAKLFSYDSFHNQLVSVECSKDELACAMEQYMQYATDDFGVLCLLYSIILTAGLEKVKAAVEDTDEALIDPKFGHGGQCLVNLVLTGEATPYVFDGEKDAGGLKLSGISQQSMIGFLSQMEAHRLVEVGWNLKNPSYPIWVLGSETHFSVLFSKSLDAVREDKQTEAMRILNGYDTEGNGFINADHLGDVMSDLGLFSDAAYVNIMKDKLDSEGLGIILVKNFLETFYSKETDEQECKSFDLYHYNGIKRSNSNNEIQFHRAKGKLLDFTEPVVSTDSSHMIKCLQTKWPTIELQWDDDTVPSLN